MSKASHDISKLNLIPLRTISFSLRFSCLEADLTPP